MAKKKKAKKATKKATAKGTAKKATKKATKKVAKKATKKAATKKVASKATAKKATKKLAKPVTKKAALKTTTKKVTPKKAATSTKKTSEYATTAGLAAAGATAMNPYAPGKDEETTDFEGMSETMEASSDVEDESFPETEVENYDDDGDLDDEAAEGDDEGYF